MRLLSLFLFFVGGASLANALSLSDFKVIEEDDEFYLKSDTHKELKQELTANLEAPTLIELKPVPSAAKEFQLLIYRSGSLGTYKHYDVQWALLLNTKTWKVIGEAPWSYTPIDKKDVKLTSPKWKFLGAQVLVEDSEFDEKFQFKLE